MWRGAGDRCGSRLEVGILQLREFYSRCAGFYDADYAARGYSEDIPFYVKLAVASGGPVLEMGCGTGRILLPAARAGVRVHGMDASRDMLARLRESLAKESREVRRRVSLTRGDIRSARADRKFALVTAPFRVAQHLLERADQRAWLRNVRRHLRPGGALCFDVFQPDYRYVAGPREPEVDLDRTDPATGRRVRRFSRTVPQPERQRIEVHFRWLVENASGKKVSESTGSSTMRWFTRGELENLLELEGFRITHYWGSFRREPFGRGSEQQIVRAIASGRRRTM